MPTNKRKQPKARHKLPYGQGSFGWDATLKVWMGRYDTGLKNARGKRIIIRARAADEDTAWQRFQAKKKQYLIEGPKLVTQERNQTVEGWAETWLKIHKPRVRPRVYKNAESHVTKWIIPHIGKVKLRDLTAAHVRRLEDAVKAAGRSSTTALNVQRTLVNMLNAAKADGYDVPDRVFATRKAAPQKSRRESMTKEQVQAVFAKAYELYPDAIRFIIAVIYGGRQSEILGVTLDDVHFFDDVPTDAWVHGTIDIVRQVQSLPYLDREKGVFDVPDDMEVEHLVDSWHFTEPKTARGTRTWPLIAPVASELRAWMEVMPVGEENPWNLLFPRIRGKAQYLGYPRNKGIDRQEWVDLQRAAGVYKRPPNPRVKGDEGEFYVLHEARHSMISILKDAGVPDHIVEMLVGQTQLVKGYVHGSMDVAGKAVDTVFAGLLPARD